MGTPLIKIVQEVYELTQWLAAQDQGFSRNRRIVLERQLSMRLFTYQGVVAQSPLDGGTFNPLRQLAPGGNPRNPADFSFIPFSAPAIFNNRYDFAPQIRPAFDFMVEASKWCQLDSSALNRRVSQLPTLNTQLVDIPVSASTGLPTPWNARIDAVLSATDPMNKDNPLHLHQDHYLMAVLSPLEQALWGLLYDDPAGVGEDISWYYNPAFQFAPRQRYLIASGATPTAALRDFQRMAADMRFGDGLPLIPPTRELVDEMLATTHLTSDCVLGMLKMRGGVMSIETLAANAVMVGMEPQAFPVLVAAAQAIGTGWEEDGHHWHPMTTASGPLTLALLVSGPITREIGMENEINMMGAGQPVNNSLSRAFRMFYHNFAHNLLPFIDTHGRSGRINDIFLMVVPENYDALQTLGWETHSEIMGFPTGTSTVTIVQAGHADHLGYTVPFGGGTPFLTNVDNFVPSGTFLRPAANSLSLSMFSPTHAYEMNAFLASEERPETKAGVAALWDDTAGAAPTSIIVEGLRGTETFPGLMRPPTPAQEADFPGTQRKLEAFPIVVGPENGSSFVWTSAGMSYRSGIWVTSVIHGTVQATPSAQNARSSPSAPTNVQVAFDVVARTATLTWQPPVWNGGGTIEGYEVFMYHGGVMIKYDWITVPGGAAARSYTFENLVPGEQYHFRVRAFNDVIDSIYYINRQTNIHVGGVTGAPTGPLLGAPAGEYWLVLNRIRGRGAWGRAECADRTAYANAADIAEGTMTAADVARGVRPIFSHMPIQYESDGTPARVRPPEITAALQNLIYVHEPWAPYTVRLPQNIPFEVSPIMDYLTLPNIRFRPGGDEIPQALIDHWAERLANMPRLSTLSVSPGTLSPVFSPGVFAYSVNVGTASSITVTATAPTGFTVTGTGQHSLAIGSNNIITVTVTSDADPAIHREYVITVTRTATLPQNGGVGDDGVTQQPTDPDDGYDDDDDDNGYEEDEPQVPLDPPPGFVDVPTHWAREAIEFVHGRGIMIGVSDTMFAPDAVLTRAMMATILWRLEGEPSTAFAPVFSDVPAGRWYSEAIVWASEQDIVKGIGGGLFDPHSNITREQFAAMMHRYAVFIGVDTEVPATHSLAQFTDRAQIGDWALGYVMWANYNELLTGVTATTLQPQGNVTRAQCATVLHRFIVRFVD